jgi:hypothetical protein
MYKIKILKENKLLLEDKRGLYDLMGIMPGSLDLFLETFTSLNPTFKASLRSFVSNNFQNLIDSLREEDLPPTGARGYKTPLTKVKALLSSGVTFWWYELFGVQIASKIVRFQVVSYYIELEERLEDIQYEGKGYSEITSEDFKKLPEEDKKIIYEKHFWEDYLESFFDNQMSVAADLGKGYVGAEGMESGLYGQMNDWWMSTDGRGIMKSEMREEREELYNAFKKDADSDAPVDKEPQWFAKGENAWDDGAIGYDTPEEVVAQQRKQQSKS